VAPTSPLCSHARSSASHRRDRSYILSASTSLSHKILWLAIKGEPGTLDPTPLSIVEAILEMDLSQGWKNAIADGRLFLEEVHQVGWQLFPVLPPCKPRLLQPLNGLARQIPSRRRGERSRIEWKRQFWWHGSTLLLLVQQRRATSERHRPILIGISGYYVFTIRIYRVMPPIKWSRVHSRIVPSTEPLTNRLPLRSNATQVTA